MRRSFVIGREGGGLFCDEAFLDCFKVILGPGGGIPSSLLRFVPEFFAGVSDVRARFDLKKCIRPWKIPVSKR